MLLFYRVELVFQVIDGVDGLQFADRDLVQFARPSLEGVKVFQDGKAQVFILFAFNLVFVVLVKEVVGIHRDGAFVDQGPESILELHVGIVGCRPRLFLYGVFLGIQVKDDIVVLG